MHARALTSNACLIVAVVLIRRCLVCVSLLWLFVAATVSITESLLRFYVHLASPEQCGLVFTHPKVKGQR